MDFVKPAWDGAKVGVCQPRLEAPSTRLFAEGRSLSAWESPSRAAIPPSGATQEGVDASSDASGGTISPSIGTLNASIMALTASIVTMDTLGGPTAPPPARFLLPAFHPIHPSGRWTESTARLKESAARFPGPASRQMERMGGRKETTPRLIPSRRRLKQRMRRRRADRADPSLR